MEPLNPGESVPTVNATVLTEACGAVPMTVSFVAPPASMLVPTTAVSTALQCATPVLASNPAGVMVPVSGQDTTLAVAEAAKSSPDLSWSSAHLRALLELLTNDQDIIKKRKERQSGGVNQFWQRVCERLADQFPVFDKEYLKIGNEGGKRVNDRYKKLGKRYRNNYIKAQSGGGFKPTQLKAQEQDKTNGLYELMHAEFASRCAIASNSRVTQGHVARRHPYPCLA